MQLCNENETYAALLSMHIRDMASRMRRLTPEQWDWTPDAAAPTARTLAAHALQWLVCDRQHILESDASRHPRVPDVPAGGGAICDALDAEAANWRELLASLTPQQMDEPRSQFNVSEMNVRGFIGHIIQNTIYKNGQFSTLYFALGHDGTEPYSAPFPNVYYQQLEDGTLV